MWDKMEIHRLRSVANFQRGMIRTLREIQDQHENEILKLKDEIAGLKYLLDLKLAGVKHE
jgi:hypothetical protein